MLPLYIVVRAARYDSQAHATFFCQACTVIHVLLACQAQYLSLAVNSQACYRYDQSWSLVRCVCSFLLAFAGLVPSGSLSRLTLLSRFLPFDETRPGRIYGLNGFFLSTQYVVSERYDTKSRRTRRCVCWQWHGRTNDWTNGWISEQEPMNERMNKQMSEHMHEWMNGRIDERVSGWGSEFTSTWTHQQKINKFMKRHEWINWVNWVSEWAGEWMTDSMKPHRPYMNYKPYEPYMDE